MDNHRASIIGACACLPAGRSPPPSKHSRTLRSVVCGYALYLKQSLYIKPLIPELPILAYRPFGSGSTALAWWPPLHACLPCLAGRRAAGRLALLAG